MFRKKISGQKKFIRYFCPYLLNLVTAQSIFFKESEGFVKVNATDIPIFVEYLSRKGQLSSLLFVVYVVLWFGV